MKSPSKLVSFIFFALSIAMFLVVALPWYWALLASFGTFFGTSMLRAIYWSLRERSVDEAVSRYAMIAAELERCGMSHEDASSEASRRHEKEPPLKPFNGVIIYIVSLFAFAFVALAWFFGRLTWPFASGLFVGCLLIPFGCHWSWPQNHPSASWGRIILSSLLIVTVTAAAVTAAALIH